MNVLYSELQVHIDTLINLASLCKSIWLILYEPPQKPNV